MGTSARGFAAGLVAVIALLLAPGAATAVPLSGSGVAGPWITDAAGRVLVLHGVNEVYKVPPYYPAAGGFDDADAAFLAAQGFDAVRVGVIYAAVEPAPGRYDDAYLDRIAATVATLARHGITSLLDFHQDLYNERFQGEGFPAWAVEDDGLPNPRLGFPENYLANPALERALDHFWANDPGPGGVGLQDRFAAAWRHVAARFAHVPGVLGYELLNEPFPGTLWEQCAVVSGCPGFDARLGAFEHRVDAAIRSVDERTLVFYEPNVIFNFGAASQLPPLGDNRAVFAFHDYCLTGGALNSNVGCDGIDDLVFANAHTAAAAEGAGLLLTEFGATDALDILEAMVTRADMNTTGWLYWAYTGNDITTSGPGETQALVIDATKPPSGRNVKHAKLAVLARPYPQLVAGTPLDWSFDPSRGSFSLRWRTARAEGRGSFPAYAESDIFVPAIQYPTGYTLSLVGATLLASPGPGVLRIASCPGAREISLAIERGAGPTATSCSPPPGAALTRLRVSVSPLRVRARRRLRFTIRVRALLDGQLEDVAGAGVSLAGHRARTDASGRAKLRLALRLPGRAHVIAHAVGYEPGAGVIRVLPRR